MHKRKQVPEDANAPGVPGVQKIKAALRQTRRLLAKVCMTYVVGEWSLRVLGGTGQLGCRRPSRDRAETESLGGRLGEG